MKRTKTKAPTAKVLDVGDRVMWESQSCSYTTAKTGAVVVVVPADWNPSKLCENAGYRPNTKTGFGCSRDHRSYLIKVDGKGDRLYWPRVRHLKHLRQE